MLKIYNASAGSGKTYVLVKEYLKVALTSKAYLPQRGVLSITFTNKAAEEMKSRVKKLLKRKTLPLSIGTFHSICARLLREDIKTIGFSQNFAIYDVKDQLDLIKVLIAELNNSKNSLAKFSFGFWAILFSLFKYTIIAGSVKITSRSSKKFLLEFSLIIFK